MAKMPNFRASSNMMAIREQSTLLAGVDTAPPNDAA